MSPDASTAALRALDVDALADGAWALACLSLSLEKGVVRALDAGGDVTAVAQRTELPAGLVRRLLDVLVALGVAERDGGGGYRAGATAGTLLRDRAATEALAAEARSAILQSADLVARGRAGTLDVEGWRHEDPEILRAQGVSSGAAVPALANAFSLLGDLAERMERPGAAALDVGTGVAAIAIALCRRFPQLRVVGLEPASAPLAEARRNVVAAGMEQRVELRAQRVEDLADEAAFDFCFLPSVFISTPALRNGLAAVHRALRPGGWVVMSTLGAPGDELAPALSRLKATLWGSEALMPAEVARLCEETGYAEVRIIAVPERSTLIPIAAQRQLT